MDLIKNELIGWKKWELFWLVLATTIITSLSVYWNSEGMTFVAAVSGCLCVILTGKGKLSAYVFGCINSLLYAIIAYRSTYYGETMLNLIYYLPMNIVGFFAWKKHMDDKCHEVIKKVMPWKWRFVNILLIAAGTYIYGLVLKDNGFIFTDLNDRLPFVDAFTTVCSVVATIVSIKRFAEQWWIWIAIDVFTVYMWWVDYQAGNSNLSILLMWLLYLVNAIIMLIVWTRRAKIDNIKKV